MSGRGCFRAEVNVVGGGIEWMLHRGIFTHEVIAEVLLVFVKENLDVLSSTLQRTLTTHNERDDMPVLLFGAASGAAPMLQPASPELTLYVTSCTTGHLSLGHQQLLPAACMIHPSGRAAGASCTCPLKIKTERRLPI